MPESVLGPDVKQRLTEREWRDQLKDAHEMFDAFKKAAYKDKEL